MSVGRAANSDGEPYKPIDRAGREGPQEFDDAGRVTRTTEDYPDSDDTTDPLADGTDGVYDDYRWSSARAHLKGKDDELVTVAPLLRMAGNWRQLLSSAVSEEELRQFRQYERTGRVLGDDESRNGGAASIDKIRQSLVGLCDAKTSKSDARRVAGIGLVETSSCRGNRPDASA